MEAFSNNQKLRGHGLRSNDHLAGGTIFDFHVAHRSRQTHRFFQQRGGVDVDVFDVDGGRGASDGLRHETCVGQRIAYRPKDAVGMLFARIFGYEKGAANAAATAVVYSNFKGFRVPFRVTSVDFFRLRMSTKQPGKFERATRFRESDLMHLASAAKIVRKWLKEIGG